MIVHMSNTMTTIIQNTWDEEDDQELLDYCNNIDNVTICSESDITKIDIENIKVLFADTIVVQSLLPGFMIPGCYPMEFDGLYKRNIKVIKVKELWDMKPPYFIKPYSNNKLYEAHIVRGPRDIEFLKQDLTEHSIPEDDDVYVCDLVNFVSEHRLFVGHGIVYGAVDATLELIDPSKAVITPLDKDFVRMVLKQNPFQFCVIDVGLIESNGSLKWAVVEINPPFALTSYDWDIDKYYTYCVDAWTYLSRKINVPRISFSLDK